MVAIKAKFDGRRVILPKGLRGLPPGEVLLVFENGKSDADEGQSWVKLQESAFARAWDNEADAVYDTL